MLAVLVVTGLVVGLGAFWYLGLATAGAMFAYQQWLIRERRREDCFRAFLNNNWLGGLIFLGLLLDLHLGG